MKVGDYVMIKRNRCIQHNRPSMIVDGRVENNKVDCGGGVVVDGRTMP